MSRNIVKHPASMSAKCRSNRGSGLAETLVSVLIIALAMLMLSGAIITSARINQRAEEKNAFLLDGGQTNDTIITVTRMMDDGSTYTYEYPAGT